jgi:hypothetical protein
MTPKNFDTTRHRACLRGYDFPSSIRHMGGSYDYKMRSGSRLGLTVGEHTRPLSVLLPALYFYYYWATWGRGLSSLMTALPHRIAR